MKKTTNVCDICRRVVTEDKCEICDKDICEMCQLNLGIQLVSGSIMYYIISCRNCAQVLTQSPLKKHTDENVHGHIRQDIIKLLKNARMLEEIQDKEDKQKDKDFISGSIGAGGLIPGTGTGNILWPSRLRPRPMRNPFSSKPSSKISGISTLS